MDLQQKVMDAFIGKVVRKDLAFLVKGGLPVPTYVLEYLLGQYCASDDEEIINEDKPVLKNITSKSFGIEVVIDEMVDGKKVKVPRISNLVTKQDAVPVTITETFGIAYANMKSVDLVIYETDITEHLYEIGGNEPLGQASLELPPGLPEGAPIEVTIELSTDGLLKLRGYEVTSNKECKATMHSDAILTIEQVEEQTAAVRGLILK